MKKGSKTRTYVVRPPTAIITRGFDPRLSVGSARPPVFRASTYVFSTPEAAQRAFDVALGRVTPPASESVELIYSRLSHPNAEILEDQIAPLEPTATAAAVFNSGMAAISTLFMTFCEPKSKFIYTTPLYGGTHLFMHQILTKFGIEGVAVRAGDTKALETAIEKTDNLRLVFIETPSNPTLTMTDIVAAVKAASKKKVRPLVAVDNTLLGPAFQHPLKLGADLSVYSATKYLAGFSDMLAGVVLSANKDLIAQLRGTRAVVGNILQPDECWLLNSRLPTVLLRMNRQSKNAQRIAEALSKHKNVNRIYYPSLFHDKNQKKIRDTQTEFPGGIISIEVNGGKNGAYTFLRNLKIAHNAVSMGGMESLACHPATTTHSEMPPEMLDEYGVAESLVRLSIGVEDWRDLLEDFQNALDAC